jgi:hypothetical protein
VRAVDFKGGSPTREEGNVNIDGRHEYVARSYAGLQPGEGQGETSPAGLCYRPSHQYPTKEMFREAVETTHGIIEGGCLWLFKMSLRRAHLTYNIARSRLRAGPHPSFSYSRC